MKEEIEKVREEHERGSEESNKIRSYQEIQVDVLEAEKKEIEYKLLRVMEECEKMAKENLEMKR